MVSVAVTGLQGFGAGGVTGSIPPPPPRLILGHGGREHGGVRQPNAQLGGRLMKREGSGPGPKSSPWGSSMSRQKILMSSSGQSMQRLKNHASHLIRVLPGGGGIWVSITGSIISVASGGNPGKSIVGVGRSSSSSST